MKCDNLYLLKLIQIKSLKHCVLGTLFLGNYLIDYLHKAEHEKKKW